MPSFGEELKRERELRQISLREVAEATKISFRHLEALEANEFDELPGGVFNRGFVRAYSQFIGVDPESMVTSYLMEEQARQGADAKQEDVMRRSGSHPAAKTGTPGGLGRITATQLGWGLVAIITIAVLVGSLLVWSLRSAGDGDSTTTAEPEGKGAVTPRTADPRPVTGSAQRDPAQSRKPADEDEVAVTENATVAAPVTQAASLAPIEPPKNDTPPPAPAPRFEAPPPVPGTVDRGSVRTRIRILRSTNGRVNCDNTRIEMLAGVRPGTTVEFLCQHFLLIDIADAGAIQLGLGDQPDAPLGPDGQRLSAHRIDLSRLSAGGRP